MKLIFSLNFRLLVLVLLMHSLASALALAQYSNKYVGVFDTQGTTIVPLNDPAEWIEIDNTCTDWQTCEAKGAGWQWGGYAIPGDPTLRCYRRMTGAGTSVNLLQLFGSALSRRYYIYKAKEIGSYHMEITGVAIYSNGLSRASGATAAITKYAGNRVAWRQVPTSDVAPEWHWLPAATMEQTTIDKWLELDVTPKYQLLCNKDWNMSEILAGDNNSVNLNLENGFGAWVDLPMESPIVFNPDSNLELVFVQDSFAFPSATDAGFENNISGWEYKDPDGDMCTRYRDNQSYSVNNIGYTLCQKPFFNDDDDDDYDYDDYTCYNSNMKPHLRLRYRYLSCENVKPSIDKTIYMVEENIPTSDLGVSFEMKYAPEGATHDIIYTIVGPAPYTDTVYTTNPVTINSSDGGSDELRSYSSKLSDFANVTAQGIAVAADGNSVDCSKLEPGEYTLIASVATQLDGFYANEGRASFSVSAGRDLIVSNILEPANLQQYAVDNDNPVRVIAEIYHNSALDEPAITEFYVAAYLYPMEIDPFTGLLIRWSDTPIDTLPHKTAGNSTGFYHWTAAADNYGKAVEPGDRVQVYDRQLTPGFSLAYLPVGYYDVEVKVWVADETWDLAPINNVYPRAGRHHLMRVQNEYDIVLGRAQIEPPANYLTYLGSTVNVVTSLRNEGLLDISDKSGYFLQTRIHRYSATAPGRLGEVVWAPYPYVIRSGSSDGDAVNIPCIDDITLTPLGWQVNDTGRYVVQTQLLRANTATPPVLVPVAGQTATSTFSVAPGLSGTYRISSAAGSHFKTIKEATDALYRYGVSGDVRFELPDAVYNERSWTATNTEAPALDFRGKIVGVCDTLYDAFGQPYTRIRKISFVPSGNLANQRGSIRINLESKSGYGMRFGAADDAVAHPAALVNDAPTWEKINWFQSDGYITWDGGSNQSFRISLKAPAAADYAALDPIRAFRAPIYMSNAKNITIANCIIEDNEASLARSEYFLLPGHGYNGPELRSVPDYEVTADITKAYSAGIVMRSMPPYQARYGSNYYGFDTLYCQNITLQNNDISRFSYGIASIGLDYRNGVNGSLIDIVDTLYDLSIATLSSSAKYEDCSYAMIYPNVPAGGRTIVSWFKERVSSLERGTRYYKHHTVQQSNGTLSYFVQVVDSLTSGVARVFNRDGLIENNLIHDIGRAGIFLGNDENTIVRGNMITGVTGNLKNSTGNYVTDVDVAGILLGGNQRLHVNEVASTNGFMVVGTEIYKNEINNISGYGAVNGIKLEQSATNEGISAQRTTFPDRAERIKIYSNMIWGLSPRNSHTSRYGINLSLAKKNLAPSESLTSEDNMYYSTGHATHFIDQMLVANNTIVLGEDGYYNSDGDYFGLRLQRIKNGRILNNAIELEDSTQSFASTNNSNFAALIYYQGASPTELNNQIDYNAYGYRLQGSSAVDVYCHLLTDIAGSLIDFPHRGEYRDLTNWQNWLHNDFYSVVRSFSGDLQASQDYYPRLRFRTNPMPSNSPLDKRGTYLAEAQVDIDGVNRVSVNQNLDIGAQYVSSTKLAYDVEVLSITSPATYKATVGPWADAEYFMIPDAPITVRAKVRNNGSSIIQNKRINLRVYEEPSAINNNVAALHENNYSNTYYDNELALHNEKYTFPFFDPTDTPFWEGFRGITLSPGEDIEIEFQMDKSFNSYYYLQGYAVPIQFSAMAPNVTPRYLFVVSTDDEGDLDLKNNNVQKYARFYIKKSERNMLLSAVNSYHNMMVPMVDAIGETVLDEHGLPVYEANSDIKNLDWIAGRLNLDTLQAGFNRLKYYQIDNEAAKFDFDILDRYAWDYRNIDYTLYQTVYVSDELDKNEGRWATNRYDKTLRLFREQYHAQNLLDFLQETASASKKNLVLASENYINDVYKSLFRTKPFYILSDQTQRDTFLYNDIKRLAFVSPERRVAILRDSLQKVLVRDYFRANPIYDSLTENGPYSWNDIIYSYEYQPIYPLYEKGTINNGGLFEPNWNYLPQPYQFSAKLGTITGKSLNQGNAFEIKPTGWGWIKDVIVEDTPPFGAVFRPIDNFAGQLAIGAVYDTLTKNPAMSSTAPDAGKVAALCVSTIENNIILLGFDWRHFGNIEVLLENIMEHIVRNGGSGDDSPNLPISFYGFDAKAISNRAELFWNTSSGSVIDKFEVERADVVSEKIGNFSLIETISAKPTASDNFYNTTDKNLAFGHSFAYRLKLIDASGSFVYTDTKILDIEESQFSISDIVPNPVNSVSEFSINNQMDQNLHIAIYDMSGKEMLTISTGMLSSGIHNFKIDSKHLPQATYSLTIRGEQQTIAKQFTVVK